MIKSEHTKDMERKEARKLREQVRNMTQEELKEWRNSHDPDSMGYAGEEAI